MRVTLRSSGLHLWITHRIGERDVSGSRVMGLPSRIVDLPPSPMLRPGVRITRRDERHLQVGTDPPRRTVLPDVQEVRDVLEALRHGHTPTVLGDLAAAAVTSLVAADLVVPHHPARLKSGQFGGSAASRIARLGRSSVDVRAGKGCASWATDIVDLLVHQGVSQARPGVRSDLIVVLTSGEVAREELDELMRQAMPHLVIVSRAGGVEIGPFVEPGTSACHRCVDAHRGEADPRRVLILEQIARQIDRFEDEPMDPVLTAWATAWAVRDVCRRLEGDVPSTRSTSYLIGPDGPPQTLAWTRHPHCGCAWADDFGLQVG